MSVIDIIIISLFMVVFFFSMYMFRYKTRIGKEGYRNVFIQNLCNILCAIFVFLLTWRFVVNNTVDSFIYPVLMFLMGVILLIAAIIGITALLKEKTTEVLTETLYNVKIVPAGYRNRDRQLEGTVNGTKRRFLFRGVDKQLARKIKDNHLQRVTVTYYLSTNRIEKITF